MAAPGRSRLVVLSLLVVLLAGLIGYRLYGLQVERSDEFRKRAAQQHRSTITVMDPRGAILDREGRELAVSIESQSLYAHPRRVAQPERVAELLAPVIGVSRKELLDQLRSDKPYVYLKRFLDPETVEAVQELELAQGDVASIGFEPQPRRIYPQGKLGVHFLGYATIDGVGVEGLEKELDAALQGGSSVYLVLQDARSGGIRQLVRPPEKRPMDVVLSIDLVLQHIAERELDQALRETGTKAASAVVLDPRSGQVLALANRPAADPNRYGRSRDAERVNRALVHFYEPGSTFKFVPMAAALERGAVSKHQRIFCENGSYMLGSRRIRDVSRKGLLTPAEIIAYSSNIGMVKITSSLSEQALAETISAFGFGHRTGIELPGESPGLTNAVERWSSFSKASLSFGQEIGVTPMQMAQALAIVANGGYRIPPRLVLGTRGPDGTFHRFATPDITRVIRSETASELRGMLEGVIESGTGSLAGVPGYRVAGKSGTAQKALAGGGGYSETDYIASFGGFGPTEEPELVVLVVLDTPRGERHQGGRVAGPVFARIMQDSLRYLRIPARRDLGTAPLSLRAGNQGATPLTTPREASPADARWTEAGEVPDLRGMSLREAVAQLALHGYRTEVRGSGRVVRQSPAPGTRLAAGSLCSIRLRPAPSPSVARSASRERSAG